MSDYLFDVSPTQDEPATKRGRRREAATAIEQGPEKRVDLSPLVAAVYGRADEFVCLDQRCQGTAHDITHISGGRWRIECAFCGMGQWVKAGKTEGAFRFPEGLFEGLTIDEASQQKNGLDYIKFVSKKDPSEAVRAACQSWLDSFGGRL